MFDYGMDGQQAIDFPCFFWKDDVVEAETGTPRSTVEGLRARGHGGWAPRHASGGPQATKIDWHRGVLISGSEPRKEGCALGY
ncbi:gamma-glutamyltransferase family protein [Mesorhizobium sp. M0046]